MSALVDLPREVMHLPIKVPLPRVVGCIQAEVEDLVKKRVKKVAS